MTDTITASFQFNLTGVTGTPFDTNTRQNVKKRISHIVYLKEPPADATRLAFVGSQEIIPSVSLFIGDRSDSLYANSYTSTEEEFLVDTSLDAGPREIKNFNFLVTQQFIEAESGPLPLYFKHSLSSTSIIPESVKVYDKEGNEVGQDKYKLVLDLQYDNSTGLVTSTANGYILFNSLENEFDYSTGSYSAYFVQYTEAINSVDTVKTEILNNEKAYQAATAEDFWDLTPGSIKPWGYAYHLEEDVLLLPKSTKYSLKYIESQRVSVKHPVDYTDVEPWFPRIVNGKFTHGYSGHVSLYDIPEFDNQAFNPISPYKLAAKKLCQKVDTRLFKLPHEEIKTGDVYSSIDVVVEKDEVAEYAITTDTSKDGNDYRDFDGKRVTDSDGNYISWSSTDFLGLDRMSGLVHVDFDLSDSHSIYATYPYKENFYAVTSLMMNPVFDTTVHNQTRVLYLIPQNTFNKNAGHTSSIMWLKVSRAGTIDDVNQNGTEGNAENLRQNIALGSISGFNITGVLGLHYSWRSTTVTTSDQTVGINETVTVASTEGFPATGWLRALDETSVNRYFKYDLKTSTTFVLSGSTSEAPNSSTIPDGNTVELVNFIDERTTLSQRDAVEEEAALGADPANDIPEYPSNWSQFFILAEMAVNPPHSKEGLSVIDVREDGGGVDSDLYEEAKLLNPEIQWLSDTGSFDGQIYPSNAVIVIKLPKTILQDFTLDNLRQMVKEKVPYGVYPLIRFYGYEPRVISITPGAAVGSVDVLWEKEGSEFLYDIWYTQNENGQWTKANASLLSDGVGSYNSYTVTGLTGDSSYFIKITMQDRYYSWWYGYTDPDSIEGGLGLDETTPVAPFGNYANFQFRIL